LLALLLLHAPLSAVTIKLHKQDAAVWSRTQLITGEVDTVIASNGWLEVNGVSFPFEFQSQSRAFSVPAVLDDGVNILRARIDSSGVPVYSDTLRLTLGYKLRPEVYAYATVVNRTITLHGVILDNPRGAECSFFWRADAKNPIPVDMASPADSVTIFILPESAPPGEYYFDLDVYSSDGDTARVRTLVTASSADVRPFDIKTDHAAWIDRAIIYGVTPYIFVSRGKFRFITQKLPELAQLGINAIWMQPIYETPEPYQGYHVTDYFAVREDLGGEGELRTLIQTAHKLGIKILFDFVPNHTSIRHPYAKDAVAHGTDSHYYDFYQRQLDSAPYAMHYHRHPQGFVYYFWNELPNLNYGNPEVQRMMIEAGKYWIENFNIDGYRVDAAWAVNARRPEFMQQWRLALKRIKPEILLLGEDKATWPSTFEERFDAAYDWAPEESWVSHWTWQTTYSASSNPTIFNNSNQNIRSNLLRNALTNNGAGFHPRAKVFRFMENNDTFRFRPTHDLARTKMAAALLFSLPGIPLIFNGQEVGATDHPYDAGEIFYTGGSIRSLDRDGLFPYYQLLTGLRTSFPALSSDVMQEVAVTPANYVYAYRRWQGEQNIFGVINMGNVAVSATMQLPVEALALDSTKVYHLTDLIFGESMSVSVSQLAALNLSVDKYTTRLFLLTDTLFTTTVQLPGAVAAAPQELSLAQNFPNPFNPATMIEFSLPRQSRVTIKVYDLLGREVVTVLDAPKQAGRHRVTFNGHNLASGVYFYRMQSDEQALVRKMILIR